MSALAFDLPPDLEAPEPPEARGVARDGVRLMVASRCEGRLEDRVFSDLPEILAPGDLLVVNRSATLAASLPARRAGGAEVRVNVATADPRREGDGSRWVVEVRGAGGSTPIRATHGEVLALPAGASVELLAPYARGRRLWLARVRASISLHALLAEHGHPIRYGYVRAGWPLSAYQTVFSSEPGSAEMPSAGRPFTGGLVARLVSHGVLIATITLHTGVSSLEAHELPYPERYEVPAVTARLVEAVRGWGGRVIAVGTTVVRALETAADPNGSVRPSRGWTELVITPERGVFAVDGLITGWHEPGASHLQMLEAVGGGSVLARSYGAARSRGYLWHEFGDSHLILP
ncbi:MAG: S-adenosylmethionine:tRNA ribosyltransferase-isomerase [Solirubrobacterales bacterium]|nr:S-adenosylmethionine:tRNA ribosyltransferase-isomerase [Solirubrobacterales bacterium]